jgi:hypothetical protein
MEKTEKSSFSNTKDERITEKKGDTGSNFRWSKLRISRVDGFQGFLRGHQG